MCWRVDGTENHTSVGAWVLFAVIQPLSRAPRFDLICHGIIYYAYKTISRPVMAIASCFTERMEVLGLTTYPGIEVRSTVSRERVRFQSGSIDLMRPYYP